LAPTEDLVATEIVRLAPQWMPALRRFAETVWQRPRSEAFYRWRYQESAPFHDVWLAIRDGECVAMEAAIRRPWRVGGERVDFLEVFDWFVLPQYRNAGLGVRVMQALMREPHPLLLVGGSADTQGLLPRLKWQIVATSERYVLPLAAARLAPEIQRRLRLPLPLARMAARAALMLPGQSPRRRARPADGRVVAIAGPSPELFALYEAPSPYGTVPLWSDALLRWLVAGHAGIGHFVPLCFAQAGSLVGWALLRILPTPNGCDAELIECFAPRPSPDLYTWMVSEAATLAAAFAPGMLGAQTTCPMLAEALRRNRFRRTIANPVQLWWPAHDGLPGPLAVGSNTNDVAIARLGDPWWWQQAGEEAPAR
jgi:hypothetical protein